MGKLGFVLVVAVAMFGVGCSKIMVYPVDLAEVTKDKPLKGVPFRMSVTKAKITTYNDNGGTALLRVCEIVRVADESQWYVVEGKPSPINPFATLKSTTTLNADGTLASFAFESDPKLADTVAAAGELFGAFSSKAVTIPATLKGKVASVHTTFASPPCP